MPQMMAQNMMGMKTIEEKVRQQMLEMISQYDF